jgi:hypothetical protein
MVTPIPNNLRAARRALDAISTVEIVHDWRWYEDIKQWVLHCRISIAPVPEPLIPQITEWYTLVSANYPWGSIKFYPAKQNSLEQTFPHQNYNSEGSKKHPWRDGRLCLVPSRQSFEHRTYSSEPYDNDLRLYWNFQRAIQWLEAASQNTLVSFGDPFELPYFPINNLSWILFSEGSETFAQWQEISDSVGFVDYALLPWKPKKLLIKSFKSASGKLLLSSTFGKTFADLPSESVGIWIRLKSVPVLEPWQAPSTWKELRAVCREQGINLDEKLKSLIGRVRDDQRHLLLIGFPMPTRVGGEDSQMHWQPILLPTLSRKHTTAKGFRPNELGYWQRDRTCLLRNSQTLDWGVSKNWHFQQISNRGRFPQAMTTKKVLIIGVGAIGSVVAELLVRGSVLDVTLADPDFVEIGNFVRHPLDMTYLNQNKAVGVATRLNLASPHANVEAIEYDFSWIVNNAPDRLHQFDVIVDCTANDDLLNNLGNFMWDSEKLFVSISLGVKAKRLFCFSATGTSFPHQAFMAKISPWLQKEQEEYKDLQLTWEGIGCWNPVFPARADDIWMQASIAVKHIETILKQPFVNDDLTIFEQQYDSKGDFCGVRRLTNYEASD